MRSTNAENFIEMLEIFFACFGLPEDKVSNNGPPFGSEKFLSFLRAKGIKVSESPPYHSQSNELAERAVRTVKDSLKTYLLDTRLKPLSLQRKLNHFLISYRNSPCTVTKVTPSERVFCYVPHTLIAKVNPIKKQERQVSTKEETRKQVRMIKDQDEYEEEEELYYKNHFKEHVEWIPAIVKKKISGLRYLISLNGVIRMVHKNQIRKKDNRIYT